VTGFVGRAGSGPTGIQPMRWWDIEPAAALERVLFATDSPWTPAMFWAELAAGHHYVVYRERSRSEAGPSAQSLLGYAGLAVGPDAAGVQTIGVAPSAQGRGIGRALLHDLLAAAGDLPVLLEVRCDNEPAIALYASEGFERIGRRRRYYQPSGADAYTMLRPAGGKISGSEPSTSLGGASAAQQVIFRGTP
jgi:ribosomal-protein-alanine N-acetyltransferase